MATELPNLQSKDAKMATIISQSKVIHSDCPVVYQLTPNIENIGRLKRMTIGKKDSKKENKAILLVGETGAGKSTLTDSMINYAMGVQWEDKKWFQIVKEEGRSQTKSQTSSVNVYEIFGFEGVTLPYSLTVIDTPGYGDTRGKQKDAEIRQQLLDLFRSGGGGVHEISAVGLVMKATDNRLTDRLKYVFESVVSLFGKDTEKKIVALMTHSDGMPPKNALQAIVAAKIKCAKNEKKEPVHFLFNNCQNQQRDEETEMPLESAWRQTIRGMERFKQFLDKSQPKTMTATVEVLNSRIRLSATIHNLQEKVKAAEMKQEAIRKNQEKLQLHQDELENDENFTIDVEVEYQKLEDYESLWLLDGVTRCNNCEENCHYPGCTIALNASLCEVMDQNSNCTVCSGRCPSSVHVKDDKKYVTKTKTVKKTLQGVKDKYEARVKDSYRLFDVLQKQKENVEAEIIKLQDEAYHHVLRLEQFALTFDTVSTQTYLNFLIERMKERGETEKVKKLENLVSQMDDGTKLMLNQVMKFLNTWQKKGPS